MSAYFSIADRVGAYAKLVAAQAILLIPAVSLVNVLHNDSFFGWHPFLALIGSMLLVPEGILLLKSKGVDWPNSKVRKWTHILCGLGGAACLMGSFYVIYTNKNAHGKNHYQTYHSWVGLCSIVLLSVNILLGIGAYFFKTIVSSWLDKPMKKHKSTGKYVYVITLVTVAFGLYSGFGTRMLDPQQIWIYLACLVANWVAVNYLRSKPSDPEKRKKKKEKKNKKKKEKEKSK